MTISPMTISPMKSTSPSDAHPVDETEHLHYRRIREAIHYLVERRDDPPSLEETAEVVGLSPSHFHRLFTQWAGVSPSRFVRYLQLEEARRALRDGASVLDATWEAGVSSPGRLHDLFVTLDALTPGEHKRGGEGLEIAVGAHDSPFGRALLGVTGRGVAWLSFHQPGEEDEGRHQLGRTLPAAKTVDDADLTGEVAERIFRPARGAGDPREIRVLARGTNFQVKVWEALLRIPPGRVVSYGDVARAVGKKPGAARAVGRAVGSNPVSYLIPCHRVLKRAGGLSGYRWGSERKRSILAWEAARAEGLNPR